MQNIYKAAVAVSVYHGVPSLDVCPPVQENLHGPEVAFLSSPVEGSRSILSETHRDNTLHIYMEYNWYVLYTTKTEMYIHKFI